MGSHSQPGRDAASAPRVAFVLAHVGRGGTEEQARLLIEGCTQRGLDVRVFVLSHQLNADVADGMRVTYLDRARPRRSVIGLVRAARALRRALKDGDYDVVHAILARAHVVAPLLRPKGTRAVAWRRNMGDHLLRHPVLLLAERVAARRTDILVTNSDVVAEYWSGILRVPRARFEVIPNALEPWRFEGVPAPADEREPLLVTIGGLRPVKGHSVLLDAAALLRPDHPVQVAIVGEGPLREALMIQANAARVPLELPGHVRDPRPWLARAAVYVHPSLSEGSSNAVLEAMAYGCPVVATRTGDSASSLDNFGIVVPSGDPVALASAVARVLDDPALAARLGRAASTSARTRYTVDRMVMDHINVYKRLVASGSA